MRVLRLVLAGWMMTVGLSSAENPLPEFELKGELLSADNLRWLPTGELEHPGIIKTEGLPGDTLGKYYLYYGPHNHEGIGLAYADSLDGPWKEFKGNPVVKGVAAPDVRWIEEKKKFFLWGHAKNAQTELWTSDDGIRFEHQGVSIKASTIGTKNATYTRCYRYPLERFGSNYLMLYSGYRPKSGKRSIWLAHSKDAIQWTQLETPLVEPVEGENLQLYCPAFLRWQGRNYVVYADGTGWRGGNLKYVEVDPHFASVGAGGERRLLLAPPEELAHRLRSPEFLLEGDLLHMISGGGRHPRRIVHATAPVAGGKTKTGEKGKD
ncbi:MAG: hypothetical protein ACON5N_09805 [Akkermansiaceae bacterium]